MQKLILPINNCKATASFKNPAYVNHFGFPHYGTDLISTKGAADRRAYSSGNGTVLDEGWDFNAGYTVIILYPKAYNRNTKKYEDIVFRYFHLNSIRSNIRKGTEVTKDTLLGEYGGSGGGSMTKWSKHLHIEADTDTRDPNYSGTFIGSAKIIKGTVSGASSASMVNPLYYLQIKRTPPDNQTYTTTNDRFINTEDKAIPTI